ncbi:MAG: class I SAM-dependent methyltransferase [Candidatus Bathycorpusculaceae bacterium]
MSSKEYFNQVAHQWDEMRPRFFSESVREKALSIAEVQEGKIAADIGAGTGFITEGLIRKSLQVIAVDQSEAMLKEMRKKFAHCNKIDYRIGEAESLPIADEAIDYVFANMYLHHVESPQKAIKEMARILKPGGQIDYYGFG